MDKVSYALGLGIGQNLRGMGATNLVAADFAQAIDDVLRGHKPAIDYAEAQRITNQYFRDLQQRANAAAIEAGRRFLEENGKRPGVITTPSGLQYEVVSPGHGLRHPRPQDSVECHYEGRLLDGTVFDSSYRRHQTATFGVTQVIQGWVEALQLMTEGAKWKLYIPYNLAYGARGAGNDIPPYAALVFDIELIKIILK